MKQKIVLTALFIGILFSQLSVCAQASQTQGDNTLRAWLEDIVSYHEKSPDSTTHSIDATTHTLMGQVMLFYQSVGYQSVWADPVGLLPSGDILLQEMKHGMQSDSFIEEEIFSPSYPRIQGVSFPTKVSLLPVQPHVRLDVMLTTKLLQYAHSVSQGRVEPKTLPQNWSAHRREPNMDYARELALALRENRFRSYLASLHPERRAYTGLQKALDQYEAIRQNGGWPAIEKGPTMRMGDSGSRVAVLKRRLALTADLPGNGTDGDDKFDENVKKAVERFQHRHGLKADGLVGKNTLAQLNVPVEERISCLSMNMERWRWLPDSFGKRYVMVNIPAFELKVVNGDKPVETFRVIVGKKHRKTPVMSGSITYLEINPYWNVPRRIARKDILPKVVKDPMYLTRKGIRIFESWNQKARELDPSTISWETLTNKRFPYRLRQDPSEQNALGRIKFMFPNRKSVYIHDTPSRSLFSRMERTFSSGCVRIETPELLAQNLLSDRGWDKSRIETAIAKGKRRTMALAQPMPVHLVYFTAWVNDKGKIHFRKDIYGRDRDLSNALKRQPAAPLFCNKELDQGLHLAVAEYNKVL